MEKNLPIARTNSGRSAYAVLGKIPFEKCSVWKIQNTGKNVFVKLYPEKNLEQARRSVGRKQRIRLLYEIDSG